MDDKIAIPAAEPIPRMPLNSMHPMVLPADLPVRQLTPLCVRTLGKRIRFYFQGYMEPDVVRAAERLAESLAEACPNSHIVVTVPADERPAAEWTWRVDAPRNPVRFDAEVILEPEPPNETWHDRPPML